MGVAVGTCISTLEAYCVRRGKAETGGGAYWPVSLTILISEFQGHWKKRTEIEQHPMWTSDLHVHMHTCVYTHMYTYAQRSFKMRCPFLLSLHVFFLERQVARWAPLQRKLMNLSPGLGLWIIWVGFPFSSYSPLSVLIYSYSIGVPNA